MLYSGASCLPDALGAGIAHALRTVRRTFVGRAGRGSDTFGQELVAALQAHPPQGADIVLAHSVSAANLASLAEVDLPIQVQVLHAVLRRSPEDMDRDDGAAVGVAELLRVLAHRHGPRLRLHADTEALAEVFSARTGLPVGVLPLPVQVPPPRTGRADGPPRLLFAGGARMEKGYALLPQIAAAISGKASLVVHAGVVNAASDPMVQRAHRALLSMDKATVSMVHGDLSPEAYGSLLQSADLLLLPYHPALYAVRSSGILAEALALGIPAVVPANTWMADAAPAGTVVEFHSQADVVPSIASALRNLPDLTAAAVAAAPAWRDRHSPEMLLNMLLGPAGSGASSTDQASSNIFPSLSSTEQR